MGHRSSFALTRQLAFSLVPLSAIGFTIAAATSDPQPTATPTTAAPPQLVLAESTTTTVAAPTTTIKPDTTPSLVTTTTSPLDAAPDIGARDRCSVDASPDAVHVDAATGHDDNPGTEAAPLRSIAMAFRAAGDGGSIVIHPGTYRTALGSRADGWVPNQVHLSGLDGAPPPLLTGTEQLDWQPHGDGWTAPFDNRFDPSDVRGGQVSAEQRAAPYQEQVFVDGVALRQVLHRNELAPDTFHHDRWTRTISIAVDPDAHAVEVSTMRRAALFAGADGSTLTCLDFAGYAPAHRDGIAALVIDSDGVTLRDVTIRDSAGTGLGVFGRHVILDRVTVTNNGAVGATVHRSDGFRVTHSTFDHNNAAGFQWTGCGAQCVLAGMKITASSDVVVEHSTFADNTSTGLWCDLGCIDVEFRANTVRDNAKHGIFFEVSRDATITDNLVHGNGRTGLRVPGSDNATFERNLLAGNEAHLVVADDLRSPNEFPGTGVDTDPTGIVVVHNVFADTPASTSMVLDLFNTTDRSPALGRISDMRDNCYVFDAPLLERFVVPGLEVFSSPAAFSAATGYAAAHVMAAEPSDCQAALPTAVCMTAATGTTRRLLERFCDA